MSNASMKRTLALLSCACAAFMSATAANATDAPHHRTFQDLTCPVRDRELQRMLDWSEQFNIHTPEFRGSIRAEAVKLQERCLHDLSMASLNRYVMLMKLLYDDEADEVEGYE